MFTTSRDLLRQLGYMSSIVHSQPHLQPLLRRLLKLMHVIRSVVNHELRNASVGSSKAMALCRKKVDELMIEFQCAMSQGCPSAQYFEAKRREFIEKDIGAVECWDPMQDAKLRAAIVYLRQLEETRDFHANLLAAQDTLVAYPTSTYAYGTTWYRTLKCLLQLPPVARAIDAIRHKPHPHACTVFGSSTGSLVVYTALSAGIPVRGVEILPYLVAQSQKMLEACNIDAAIAFLLDDMLNVPLDDTRLLLLASQCWDDQLWRKLVSKLQQVQPPLVILDYTDRLSSEVWCSLVATGVGAVSWDEHHRFYVYAVQQE